MASSVMVAMSRAVSSPSRTAARSSTSIVLDGGNFGARPNPPKRGSNWAASPTRASERRTGHVAAAGDGRIGRAGDDGPEPRPLLDEVVAVGAPRLVDPLEQP